MSSLCQFLHTFYTFYLYIFLFDSESGQQIMDLIQIEKSPYTVC
jgi:hypothetical protein